MSRRQQRWIPWLCDCAENIKVDPEVDDPFSDRGRAFDNRGPALGRQRLAAPPSSRPEPAGPPSSASSASASGTSGRRRRERVLVHVYDLGDSFLTRGFWNSVAKGYGAFHTGVEVYGREWLFGVALEDLGEDGTGPPEGYFADTTGVSWHAPKQNLDHSFRETLFMGFTHLSEDEVMNVVEDMKRRWKSSTYNVFTRNCHDFSNELCMRLGVSSLPSWVNALAPTGLSTYEFFENTDSGYDGGEALLQLFGSIKSGFWRGLGWDEDDERDLPGHDTHPSQFPARYRAH